MRLEMRVEVNHGAGEKSEVVIQGYDDFINLNKLYKKLLIDGTAYRIEVYRN